MIHDMLDTTSEPLITPEKFYGIHEKVCDACIVTFSRVMHEHILTTYKCEKIAEIGACNGNIPIYAFEHNGRRIAFYLTGIGSTMAGTCIQESNCLIGAKNYIMFGSAGCLNSEAVEGKMVVPTHAYRDEGFSHHYCPPSDYIELKNAKRVAAAFERLGVPYAFGRTWTTDAVYRETRAKLEKRKAEGCVAVEMECAGAQAVCDYLGIEYFDFLITGDVLDLPEWDVAELGSVTHDLRFFRIALELAVAVDKGEV